MSIEVVSRSVQSSELSRNPKAVFAAADKGPVVVTRRDGENLVLMTEHEANERREMFGVAAQIIAATTLEQGTLAERMSVVFPWMLALSSEGREACARELVDVARSAFATNQPASLLVELNSWFETASALSAGLADKPTEWLDGSEVAERP